MSSKFAVGDRVVVRGSFPPGHVRTPYFLRGHAGVIADSVGAYANPEELAYGRSGRPSVPLYRVQFKQSELWPDYDGSAGDTLIADIYEHWLTPAATA